MPGGRPSKINDVVATDPDGAPVTAGEAIVRRLRNGDYTETAAAAAGIHKDTLYGWLRTAAEANGKQHRGERLSAHERRCVEFSVAVDEAQALSISEDVALTARLARGGLEVHTITVTKDKDGNETGRTERVEHLGPSERVLLWRLERRARQLYGPGVTVELGDKAAEAVGDLGRSAREALGDLLTEVAERLGPVQIVGAGHLVGPDDTPLLEATEERPGEHGGDAVTPPPSGG